MGSPTFRLSWLVGSGYDDAEYFGAKDCSMSSMWKAGGMADRGVLMSGMWASMGARGGGLIGNDTDDGEGRPIAGRSGQCSSDGAGRFMGRGSAGMFGGIRMGVRGTPCIRCGLSSRHGLRCICGMTVWSRGLKTICRIEDWVVAEDGKPEGETVTFEVPEGLLLVMELEQVL